MGSNLRCGVVVAFLLLASASTQANTYTIVDLGEAEYPWAINASGEVAGRNWAPHAEVYRGGRWHVQRGRNAIAFAINARGDLAGSSSGSRPTVWLRNEGPRVLDLPDGETEGGASGMNGDRAVVGYYFNTVTDRCFRWTPEGGSVDIGVMPHGTTCTAEDINSAGQITGEADSDVIYPHAFLWNSGVFTDLGVLVPNGASSGLAINGKGVVVGVSTANVDSHAVLWKNGKMIDLDPERKFGDSEASSINESGEIVGRANGGIPARDYAVIVVDQRLESLESMVAELGGWKLL